MNVHTPEIDRKPSREEAAEALALLRRFADTAQDGEIDALDPAIAALRDGVVYPELSRDYPHGFSVDEAYRDTLPDLQNGPASLIKGEDRAIQHVGISNFRLPIRYRSRDNGDLTLETSVTGTVSLDAGLRRASTCRASCAASTPTRKRPFPSR